MRKNLLLVGVIMIFVISIAVMSPVFAATTVNKEINGKGAAAQWSIDSAHTINAVVGADNDGKDAWLYVSMVHPRPGGLATSQAAGPANIKWSMNHLTVEATLTFTVLSGNARTGTHDVLITWQTDGPTNNTELNLDTENGIITGLNGAWKLGEAILTLDPARAGHHTGSTYSSTWAVIVHGQADISIATP